MKKISEPRHGDSRIIEITTILPLRLQKYESGFFERVRIRQVFRPVDVPCPEGYMGYGEWEDFCFVDKHGVDLINPGRDFDPPKGYE